MNKFHKAIEELELDGAICKHRNLSILREAVELQHERDQLAARCERLCAFVKYRKGKMPIEAHKDACDLLDESPALSLARHDAELLRRLADEYSSRATQSHSLICDGIAREIRAKADELERGTHD